MFCVLGDCSKEECHHCFPVVNCSQNHEICAKEGCCHEIFPEKKILVTGCAGFIGSHVCEYLCKNNLKVQILGRGMAWLDTGTYDALQDAGNFIKTIEKRQGFKIGCPEEYAWRLGLINDIQLKTLANEECEGSYGDYLNELLLKKEKFKIL